MMRHLRLFENFEVVEPIKYGDPLNNKEINFLKGYDVMCPEWISKDDGYYYIFDHRCENIKDLPLTYINAVCKKYNIQNYTINDDFTIDVDDNIDISFESLSKIPLCFNKVYGDFVCSFNRITSLEGSPKSVANFYCNNNQLTTLKGGPESVSGSFYSHVNKLVSLKGAPESVSGSFCSHDNKLVSLKGGPEYVGGNFNCSHNQLTTLEGGPKSVGGDFSIHNNQLTTLEGSPQSVGGDFYCHKNSLTSVEYKGVIKGKLILQRGYKRQINT